MEQPDPPPYDGLQDYDKNDIVQPIILTLIGRLIRSESISSPVLYYELDHDVNFLSRDDHKVVFSRNEQRVRTDRHGTVRTNSHLKHIFNLESPHAITSTSSYEYFITSVSRRTMGNAGLKKTFVPRPGFKVMQINRSGGDKELFEITRKNGIYEWWDDEGKRIAIDERENGQLKMIITTAMPRPKVDVLVAMWCLRLWHDAVVNHDPLKLAGIGRKLGIGRRDFSNYMNRRFAS